jgi:hypothetical protein
MLINAGRTATMRTSESERQRVAEFLRDACAEGRLSPDELDARLDEVWDGRTVADLERVVWDLPGGQAVVPRLGPRPRPVPVSARRRPARPPAAVLLLVIGMAVVVLASLPAFVAWTLLAMVVGLAVTTLVLTIALAPALLIGLAIAWLIGRLFRGRPPSPPWADRFGRRSSPF